MKLKKVKLLLQVGKYVPVSDNALNGDAHIH